MADNPERLKKAQEHNDRLIDLCYAEAIKVCEEAEFGDARPHDWELPSREEFRRRVRAARQNLYREVSRD